MDLVIFEAIHNLSGSLRVLDWVGVFLAEYLPYLLVLGTIFFIFREGNWKKKLSVFSFLALTVILSRGIITELIRLFYDRERPFESLNFIPLISNNDPSFPSGHAAIFFALAFSLMSLNKKWGLWFLGLAFLNGLSRIFVGVHYPVDILGGVAVALISFLIIQRLMKNISKDN